MSLTSPVFLGFALLAILLLRCLPGGAVRKWVVLALNGAFLWSFAATPMALLPLLGFILLGYAAIMVAERSLGRGLGVLVFGLVLVFVWLKRYPVVAMVPGFGFAFTVVGLSYILFRILHLLIDVAQGSLKRPPLLDYLCYLLFFLSLVSGPIQRWEEFGPQLADKPPAPDWRSVNIAAGRAVRGYAMVVVISTIASNFVAMIRPELTAALAHGDPVHGIWLMAMMCSVYLVNLYANFAGYMEIVIGIGGLAGIALPENFDHPFVAGNFLDFWARWHITLSNWFRFYLFNATLKWLSARWHSKARAPYLGVIAFFVTFTVMGIWHGTTAIFIVYGLVLGTGISLNRLWQIRMTNRLGKAGYKALMGRTWYYQLSRAMTIAYFAIALAAFWIDDAQAAWLVRPAGLAVVAGAFLLLAALGTAAGCAVHAIRRWTLIPPGEGAPRRAASAAAAWAGVAIRLALLTLVAGAVLGSAMFVAGIFAGSSSLRVAISTAIAAFAVAALALATGFAEPQVARAVARMRASRQPEAAAAWMGLRLFIVANFAVLLASAIPQFIYKAF